MGYRFLVSGRRTAIVGPVLPPRLAYRPFVRRVPGRRARGLLSYSTSAGMGGATDQRDVLGDCAGAQWLITNQDLRMYERITGPFHGYHIAVYACPMGELGTEYLGQFRICIERPASFCEGQCVCEGTCEQLCPTSALALGAAERLALREIAGMPPAVTKVLPWHATLQGRLSV